MCRHRRNTTVREAKGSREGGEGAQRGRRGAKGTKGRDEVGSGEPLGHASYFSALDAWLLYRVVRQSILAEHSAARSPKRLQLLSLQAARNLWRYDLNWS